MSIIVPHSSEKFNIYPQKTESLSPSSFRFHKLPHTSSCKLKGLLSSVTSTICEQMHSFYTLKKWSMWTLTWFEGHLFLPTESAERWDESECEWFKWSFWFILSLNLRSIKRPDLKARLAKKKKKKKNPPIVSVGWPSVGRVFCSRLIAEIMMMILKHNVIECLDDEYNVCRNGHLIFNLDGGGEVNDDGWK